MESIKELLQPVKQPEFTGVYVELDIDTHEQIKHLATKTGNTHKNIINSLLAHGINLLQEVR